MSASDPAPPRRKGRRLAAACAFALGGLAVGSVAPLSPARAAVDQPSVFLDFDELGSGGTPTSTGSVPVTTSLLTSGGGTVSTAEDSSGADAAGGGGSAADLPDYDGTSPYQRAAVEVLSQDASDPLSPGTADFEFGADFTLDTKSEGSKADNGNNLVQRGLYADRAQYKLQVDGGHVSCRVKGTSGAPFVSSRLTLVRNAWYSASCARVGSTLTLRVQPRGGAVEETTVTKAAGSVTMASSAIRLSVGCKTSAAGKLITTNSDQFNGHVDNVYLQLAPPG